MKISKKLFKLSAICLTSLYSLTTYAQQDTVKNANQPNEVTSLNKIRLTLLGVGYEREQKIGRITTFYAGAGMQGGFIYQYETQFQQVQSNNGTPMYRVNSTSTTDFKVFPSANIGIRHYFNFERRIKKGKNTRNNAAGYVAFDVTGFLPMQDDLVDYQINLGPMWGFQTNAGKKINFELCLGPSVVINNQETMFYGIAGKIGFSFLL